MELVSLYNSNGLKLDGLIEVPSRASVIVVHLHGSLGNFYHQEIVRECFRVYPQSDIAFMSMNTSAHDGVAEGYCLNDFRYVGGSLAEWDECVDDIDAMVQYCESLGFENIILQGHSLGCDRALAYLKAKRKMPVILLAQCDCMELQVRLRKGQPIEAQIEELESMESLSEFALLPAEWYGISMPKESYPVPMSRKTLLSLMKGSSFSYVSLKNPSSADFGVDCFMYLGGNDHLQVWNAKEMFDYMKSRMKSLTACFIPEGDHELSPPTAKKVAFSTAEWVQSLEW